MHSKLKVRFYGRYRRCPNSPITSFNDRSSITFRGRTLKECLTKAKAYNGINGFYLDKPLKYLVKHL